MVMIGEKGLGHGAPTYVIAELGINHGGDLDVAQRMVEAAAAAGADAVKLQTYDTDRRVPPDSPVREALEAAELDAAGHERLMATARDHGVHLISTPFDDDAVSLLAAIGVPAYKIASFDIVNLALIQRVTSEGKPLIVSRGMATEEEADRAVDVIRDAGVDMVLLHCVSAYPLEPADANLAIMDTLRNQYGVPVGYSDHTLGIDVPVLAVARGADAVEKHFTLDRGADGPDHALSADPGQLAELCARIREVDSIVGDAEPRRLDVEAGTVPYRRPTEARG